MEITKEFIEELENEMSLKTKKIEDSYLELIRFFPLRSIMTKKQYESALIIVERLLLLEDKGAKVYLQTLVDLISEYERKTFEVSSISGREMLAYLMKLRSFTQQDVAKELGGQPNVSKILKGERDLNLRQIRALAEKFKVRPSVFL